jgi:hypothetical protein
VCEQETYDSDYVEVEASSEHGSVLSGSIKGGDVTEHRRECQLFKKRVIPRIQLVKTLTEYTETYKFWLFRPSQHVTQKLNVMLRVKYTSTKEVLGSNHTL